MIKRTLRHSHLPNPSFVSTTRVVGLAVDTGPLPIVTLQRECCGKKKRHRKHRR